MDLGDGLGIVAILLTAVGLVYAGLQLRDAKKSTRGQFLLALDERFDKHAYVHQRLRPGGDWGSDYNHGPASTEEWVATEMYMGLFERIDLLARDGLLSLKAIDALYGYRLCNIVRNRTIVEAKLVDHPDGWKDFLHLWEALSNVSDSYVAKTAPYRKYLVGGVGEPGIDGSRTTEADQNLAVSRVAWDDFNKRQEFEHELINRKTTWLLTTQAILFAAYGVSLDNQDNSAGLREVIVWTGVSVALLTWIGVGTVVISKLLSWRDYAAFYCGPSHSPPEPLNRQKLQWGVRTWNTLLTLVPDLFLPLVFVLGWLLVWF
jgi:hypothetical protein